MGYVMKGWQTMSGVAHDFVWEAICAGQLKD